MSLRPFTTAVLAAAALVGGAALPAAAVAAPPAKAQTPTALAVAIAGRYWHATPCQGRITITTQQARPAGLEPDSDAWVTFDSSEGPNALAAPPSTYTDCVIALGRLRWPTTAACGPTGTCCA